MNNFEAFVRWIAEVCCRPRALLCNVTSCFSSYKSNNYIWKIFWLAQICMQLNGCMILYCQCEYDKRRIFLTFFI